MRETPASAGGLLVPPTPRLPDLRIVPGAALLLHEECDSERVERLVGRLGAEGILRNPPVVAALDGQGYVVLGGGTYTLTTPLILGYSAPAVVGQAPTVKNEGGGSGTTLICPWNDYNTGCVMIMGPLVDMENLFV